ncbi:ABC transporter ATP-binding protein [Miniimonas sp. S16]|uniref:ABC transporter ATP-binding protein n=1 Tax=Miniimonas sp. S16 TaxID=2171623 RepID=UPI000D525898|nr:ABC transporter ATP-binding protein [Miniimonas sp. S16]
MTTSGSTVTLREVVKEYGSTRVLHGVTLDLAAGELISLLGPSGCGKTTALRILAGLEQITSGAVLIGGHDVTAVPPNRRDLGMVFQAYSLFPHLSVLDNVMFGLRRRRVPRADAALRAQESLDLVGLGALEARFPHELSGGQQQRVALARALVTRPKVLLLDEPLSALDAKVRVQLREEIRAIQQSLGITTVFVTHDQEEALSVSDRVAVMNAGRIEQIGAPEDLYLRPETGFVATFVGQSFAVPAAVDGGRAVLWGRTVGVVGGLVDDGDAELLLRPEDLTLVEAPTGAAVGSGAARTTGGTTSATVLSSTFLGHARRTLVETSDGHRVAVQHAVSLIPTVGESVGVRLMAGTVAARARGNRAA